MASSTLYLMLGYPGSGKTTVAGIISKLTDSLHLWADKERVSRFDNPDHSHAESLKLYSELNQEVHELLSEGKSVVFDTNFNFRRDRDRMREIARKNNAECVLVWVQTPKDVAKKRATENAEQQPTRLLGNFSNADFDRMSNNLEEPTSDEHAIIIDGTKVTEDYIKSCFGLEN